MIVPAPHGQRVAWPARWLAAGWIIVTLVLMGCSGSSSAVTRDRAESTDTRPPTSPTSASPSITSVSSTSVSEATAAGQTSTADPAHPANAEVVVVIDGDTIVAEVGGQEEHVRLLGIDTPETVDPDGPVECFGAEASARLADLLPAGTPVQLVLDIETRDQYDRLLAYIFRSADGVFVNLALVADGSADVLIIEPNGSYASLLQSALDGAQASGLGLWGACGSADVPVPTPPPS